MKKGHRIEKFGDTNVFLERMKDFNETSIECTPHAFFRLSQKQRKIFTCDNLKQLLLYELPLKVGVQYNENYAVYYKQKEKNSVIKVIISMKTTVISIITFYNIDISEMPRG